MQQSEALTDELRSRVEELERRLQDQSLVREQLEKVSLLHLATLTPTRSRAVVLRSVPCGLAVVCFGFFAPVPPLMVLGFRW